MTRRKSSLEDRAGQVKFEQQIKRGQILTRLKLYKLRVRAWRYMTRQQALDAILALRETPTDEQRERRVQARVPPD
jgi:hypothetical protein